MVTESFKLHAPLQWLQDGTPQQQLRAALDLRTMAGVSEADGQILSCCVLIQVAADTQSVPGLGCITWRAGSEEFDDWLTLNIPAAAVAW